MISTECYLLLPNGKAEKVLSWGPAVNDGVTQSQGGRQLHNTVFCRRIKSFMNQNLDRCSGPAKATQQTTGKVSTAFRDTQPE